MKRIVLIFGLISGLISGGLLVALMPFHDQLEHGGWSLVLGYAGMLAASLLIYFGVRRYRDTVGGGQVSFGRALAVGLLIATISSLCYTATWEVLFFNGVGREFMASYATHEMDRARASGATEAELAKKRAELDAFARNYQNPAFNAALTFAEPLPVGLVMSLLSAAVLRRRRDRAPVRGLEGSAAT